MSISSARPATGIALGPASANEGQVLVAEALHCIISGRPLPERVRPAAMPVAAAPLTIEAGIERILRGPEPA